MKSKPKNNTKAQQYEQILSINVTSTPKEVLLTQIQQKLSSKQKFYIVTPNPEIILEANSNSKLKDVLNNADFAIPDGVGLGMKVIKGRILMLDLLKIANEMKLKVYLLGSTNTVIGKSLSKIKNEYPNIVAKGNSGPELDKDANPISNKDIDLELDVIKEVNLFKPDILYTAFGAPKQELWLNKYFNELNIIGAMTVGGSLDYYAGAIRPVPKFIENLKLEWLWRLSIQPKRIKRIFNATIIFPIKMFLDQK